MVERENIRVAAVHLPFPGPGHLRKDGSAYVDNPLSWRLF
jgi:hypothetical protein